ANATIFGSVRGLIHDPQHRPISAAQVILRSTNSDWTKTVTSDESGEFFFDAVPLGEYSVLVIMPGFETQEQKIMVGSGRIARLHFGLSIAKAKESVEVRDTSALVNPESSISSSIISRQEIAATPGAEQTNSLKMITDF